jgi:hypothetical protein
MLFSSQYINTIQTSCPWILRYLTTAVVTNKRRKTYIKELVKIIQQESYEYQDPITQFIEALYVHFDFEGAQQKLKECEEVLSNDFFLVAAREDFMENARQFISETYCRIHQKIDVKYVGAERGSSSVRVWCPLCLLTGATFQQRIVTNLELDPGRGRKVDRQLDSGYPS